MPNPIHTVQEVQALTGVDPRTLRYWIQERLVPKPIGRGRAARYTDDHVARITAIARLRGELRSLRAVRKRLAGLTPAQVAALAAPPRATTADGVPLAPPAPSFPSRPLEYVALMPGLGLLVESDAGQLPRRVAAEIYRHYALPAASRDVLAR